AASWGRRPVKAFTNVRPRADTNGRPLADFTNGRISALMALLEWIQNLPISTSIAESDSLWWGYAWWLFLHAVGMGLTAGLGFIICLRLLGVGRQIPVSSFRILFRIFWIGFYINLLSGTILFMTDATGISRVSHLYAKLLRLA